ncbi:hypothetical protein BOTBODRAFT_33964 [Botryobasidium botryosum FD-172 SS1]|uniref:Uncharacterized protein n=1 Tax=Botryobasidium botryosum (strain FD-172 SS1) TaxID=930990 RepID=A0A067MBE9_BOTB1|nr:hypothetical protein BOTBODRAFT_33964 [Botryobasidium botryosum FD-172 SS1]
MLVRVRRPMTGVNLSALAHSPPSATIQIPPLDFHAVKAGPVKSRAACTQNFNITVPV